jgi:lipopolysaccharide/colanic/teichoic acid biosynthesis glycosyltransferase
LQWIETDHIAVGKQAGAGILRGPGYVRIKRALDIVLALFLLVLAGLVMLLIALMVKLDSPGPVLFRQKRVGKDGREFFMLKFRSMKTGNSESIHKEHVQRLIRENTKPEDVGAKSLKMANDPRITRVGKVIRATSLDELPQLLNVLGGEMSLVGPRPSVPYEYEMYKEWHRHRLQVLPGITGLWQVKGRNQVSFDEMVLMDIDYIETMSPWLDLKIIIKTPLEMLAGVGAG